MKRFNVLTKIAFAVVVSLGMMVAMGAKAQAADKVAITDYDDNPLLYVNDVFDRYYWYSAYVYGDDYSWRYDLSYSKLLGVDPSELQSTKVSFDNSDMEWELCEGLDGRMMLGTYNTPVGVAYIAVDYSIGASGESAGAIFTYSAYIPLKGNSEYIRLDYTNDALEYYWPGCTMDLPHFFVANKATLCTLAKSKLSAFADCINATF